MLRIGAMAPDFSAETTEGPIQFHEWLGDSWAVLFSHPKDFTPVCTTELGAMARLKPEFEKRNCKIIGVSVDSVEDHKKWKADIAEATGAELNYPLIGDTDLKVAKRYGMLPDSEGGEASGRTAMDNQTVRTVFVIGPDRLIKGMIAYPMTTGRNVDEILRLLDSAQLTAQHKVATPANWRQGENVIITPAVSNEEAKEKFPQGWQAPLPYMRIVSQPS